MLSATLGVSWEHSNRDLGNLVCCLWVSLVVKVGFFPSSILGTSVGAETVLYL